MTAIQDKLLFLVLRDVVQANITGISKHGYILISEFVAKLVARLLRKRKVSGLNHNKTTHIHVVGSSLTDNRMVGSTLTV